MKRYAVGILAHVDAGKTTLSEALLYQSGAISKLGRVDNGDAHLDTDEQEKSRGITIFSKQAVLNAYDIDITLLDTPGHVDFSAEMERTLWVMDYAVLVISAADGVQGHTYTLWRLLRRYNIPVFVFVNKMDQERTDAETFMESLRETLGEGFVNFNKYYGDADDKEEFMEQAALCDEGVMEEYLNGNLITDEMISAMISERKMFPCYFGSALKMDGVDIFLKSICHFMSGEDTSKDSDNYGARVFKIARDNTGERLTYIKVTNGTIKVKDVIDTGDEKEKINQIRRYSGEKYETVNEVSKGYVVAVTGLNNTYPGQGLGSESSSEVPMLSPVLTYTLVLPEEVDAVVMLNNLRQLEEEEPELHVKWQEETKTIYMTLMGEVQIEILKNTIAKRFGVDVGFADGNILYKETINDKAYGVGHFEPLRHYAEAHLLLEKGERGSGMQFAAEVSEDMLAKNWQRLILTHLEEKEHLGVLTGSPITDMKITVVAGRAHTKHTEGGDFRQATYRAVRQGLMQANSVLLEPYYSFRLEIPMDCVGRAMTDMENMYAKYSQPEIIGDKAVLTGTVPVSTMRDYQIQVNSYTKGMGSLTCNVSGYDVCHNSEEVIEAVGYNPDNDVDNPSSSVFCSHGAGTIIPWYEVHDKMHVPCVLEEKNDDTYDDKVVLGGRVTDYSIDEEQIDAIINKTSHANEKASKHVYKKTKPLPDTKYKGKERRNNGTRYLIVDGYNIVHAWDELKTLTEDNLDGARTKLMDILCNYQAFDKCELILVFDAYKVKGNIGEFFDYNNIHVVYTKEAQTADAYIEKLTHEIAKEYRVTVATSDGLIQLITRGQNCVVMSARELKEEIERVNNLIREYTSDNE